MLTPTNALAPYIGPGGLILVVDPAVVVSNNVLVVIPQTNVILVPSATNFVFYNAISNVVQSNTTGFPNQVIPIATVITSSIGIMSITDNRPDWAVISLPTSLVNAPGSPLVGGNFSTSGWGTGASLSVISGTQTGFIIHMTAGTTPAQQPTITLTFNVAYTNPPVTLAQVNGGTGMVTDITVANTTTQSVLTYDGLPVAGKTYTIMVFNLGQ